MPMDKKKSSRRIISSKTLNVSTLCKIKQTVNSVKYRLELATLSKKCVFATHVPSEKR